MQSKPTKELIIFKLPHITFTLPLSSCDLPFRSLCLTSCRLRQESDEKDAKIKDLTDRVKILEKESKEHNEQIRDNTDGLRDHKNTLVNHKDRIEKLEAVTKSLQDRLKQIDDKLEVLGDGGLDLNAIRDLLEKLRREWDGKYATVDSVSSLEDRVSVLEDKAKEFNDKFKSVFDAHDKFAQEISKLFDVKADREDLKDMLDKINKLLKEVEEALKWKQPMVQVTNRIEKVEIQIQQLLNGLGKGGGIEMSLFKDLEDKLQKLRDDFEKFKADVMGWLKDLQNALANKADLSALKDLEKYLLSKIEDLANDLDKRFADKNETKKALKALEKQIKNLYDLIMSRQGAPQGEDDAMFAKKPLGGWSWASCAKDLINLQGIPAEFVPWRAWPFRDPNERVAKSGQGFSKILSKMKPEYVTTTNFYPSNSLNDEKNFETLQNEKITIKKRKNKKMRPMSANRAGVYT